MGRPCTSLPLCDRGTEEEAGLEREDATCLSKCRSRDNSIKHLGSLEVVGMCP